MPHKIPDYRVLYPQKHEGKEKDPAAKSTWFRVGAAWVYENGMIGLELNVGLPLVLKPRTKLVLVKNQGGVEREPGEDIGVSEEDIPF
jgi:hypothetical protein